MWAERSNPALALGALLCALVLAGCAGQEAKNGYLGPRANGRGRPHPDMSRDAAGADRELQGDDRERREEQDDAPKPLLPGVSRPAEAEEPAIEELPVSGDEQERIATTPARADDDQDAAQRRGRFARAMELIESFQYTDAQKILVELTDAYRRADNASRTAQCIFWNGYCYEKTDQQDRAIALYRNVVEDYGQTRSARTARQRLAALTASE